MRGALVELLCLIQCAGLAPIQCIQATAHEPFLVGGRITRPGPAQDQQFDLVHPVPDRGHRRHAAGGLRVGVEVVGGRPPRAGLVGQVTLGHALDRRAEHTLARAGEGLGQHRHRGHAGDGARGLRLQPPHQFGVGELLPLFAQLRVPSEDLIFGQQVPIRQRMLAQDAGQFLVGSGRRRRRLHLAQDGDEQVAVLLQVKRPLVRCPPRCISLPIHPPDLFQLSPNPSGSPSYPSPAPCLLPTPCFSSPPSPPFSPSCSLSPCLLVSLSSLTTPPHTQCSPWAPPPPRMTPRSLS